MRGGIIFWILRAKDFRPLCIHQLVQWSVRYIIPQFGGVDSYHTTFLPPSTLPSHQNATTQLYYTNPPQPPHYPIASAKKSKKQVAHQTAAIACFDSASDQGDSLQKPQAVADANGIKSTRIRKRRAPAALEKQKSKKVKNETEPVVDIAVVKVCPNILAMKLFAILLHHAIPPPSTASANTLVARKVRPDVMRPMIQRMVLFLLGVHSPQAQIKERLSITVPKKDAHALNVPPGVLKAKYENG